MHQRQGKRLSLSEYRQLKRDAINRQVQQTCSDIALKLEQLHKQVLKPVEEATDAVQSTVGTVQETMESAKTMINSVGNQVNKRPWLLMTGGLVAGLGTGLLTTTPAKESSDCSEHNGYHAAVSTKPGFLSTQFDKIKGIAVGAGLALVRDLVKDRVPEWADAADQLANDVTVQLGAVPFTSPILQPSASAVETCSRF
jgi:ElaB/YqjD/DUF883 family membrane-anchored ribosome-binding protein